MAGEDEGFAFPQLKVIYLPGFWARNSYIRIEQSTSESGLKPPPPCLMIHGGAGSRAMMRAQRIQLSRVLIWWMDLVKGGGDSCLVVKTAVECLEDSGLCNAGRGGRLGL